MHHIKIHRSTLSQVPLMCMYWHERRHVTLHKCTKMCTFSGIQDIHTALEYVTTHIPRQVVTHIPVRKDRCVLSQTSWMLTSV